MFFKFKNFEHFDVVRFLQNYFEVLEYSSRSDVSAAWGRVKTWLGLADFRYLQIFVELVFKKVDDSSHSHLMLKLYQTCFCYLRVDSSSMALESFHLSIMKNLKHEWSSLYWLSENIYLVISIVFHMSPCNEKYILQVIWADAKTGTTTVLDKCAFIFVSMLG